MLATFVARLIRGPARGDFDFDDDSKGALRPAPIAVDVVRDLFRTRDELVVENAAVRQQLIVASRKVKRPAASSVGTRLARRARQPASQLAKHHPPREPETVLRWHQQGFRLFWRRKSKASTPQQACIASETVALIRRMAADNRTWGAERIRGELLKLGIRVAKRTIQRHIHAVRPPGNGQSWRTFLRNHSGLRAEPVTFGSIDFLRVGLEHPSQPRVEGSRVPAVAKDLRDR